MTSYLTTPRLPERADAIRNRQHVLQAAANLFDVRGLNVSLEEIAKEAGVGVGTVYRHFPNKNALFAAVVRESLQMLIDAIDQLVTAKDMGIAFFSFVDLMMQNAELKRSLVETLTISGEDVVGSLQEMVKEFDSRFALLLTAAQQAGAVRGDVTVSGVRALLAGCLQARDYATITSADVRKLVAIVCDGLKNRPSPV